MQNKKNGSRLRQVLINDKRMDPSRLQEVLKNDIFEVLYQYLDIEPSAVKTQVDIEDGEYVLRCKVRTKRLKVMGFVPKEEV
ncbi:MAG: cell division topological specificity factor MinE [Clostridia bacterium]|nr:cell division topological specificity factor MinE [Clostridia bacterium]